MRCNFCNKRVTTDASVHRSAVGAPQRPNVYACPGCRKPLPRCAVCLRRLGTSFKDVRRVQSRRGDLCAPYLCVRLFVPLKFSLALSTHPFPSALLNSRPLAPKTTPRLPRTRPMHRRPSQPSRPRFKDLTLGSHGASSARTVGMQSTSARGLSTMQSVRSLGATATATSCAPRSAVRSRRSPSFNTPCARRRVFSV